MNRKSVDLLVGLFVLLGFAALVFLAVRAGNMSGSIALSDTYETRALFDNIGGLKPRAAVRSAGVDTGLALGPDTLRAPDVAVNFEGGEGTWATRAPLAV